VFDEEAVRKTGGFDNSGWSAILALADLIESRREVRCFFYGIAAMFIPLKRSAAGIIIKKGRGMHQYG
jgi:hypothetical protein